MFSIIIYIIASMVFLYNFYLFITGAFGLLRLHKSSIKKHDPKNKFAILIPARNEEQVIGSLIHSLMNQNYPRKLFEVFVIPNNCTDNTRGAAIEAGATVLNCKIAPKNKGEVLHHVFKKLKKNKDIDAYIIFDADNIVHEDFLMKMNDALCDGYEVAQGNRDSKNPHDSWISSSLSLYYWLLNIFFNKARMNFKASATINGTGFMIKKSVIDTDGFDTYTITEDLEFSALCAINKRKIAYVEDAITYDEQTVEYKPSVHQRQRWTTGDVQCLRLYFSKLVKSIFKNKNFNSFDILLRLMFPIFQVLGFVIPIVLALMTFPNLEGKELTIALYSSIIPMLLLYIGSIALFIFIANYYNQLKFSKLLLGIIFFPVFILTWLPISFKSLFQRNVKWVEIKHTRKININDIQKRGRFSFLKIQTKKNSSIFTRVQIILIWSR